MTLDIRNATSNCAILLQPQFNNGLVLTVARAGDLDGDGIGDIFIGHPSFDRVFLFLGRRDYLDFDHILSATTDSSIEDQNPYTLFGAGLLGDVDLDNNGVNDFAIGAPNSRSDRGVVHIFLNKEVDAWRRISETAQDSSHELRTDTLRHCGSILATGDVDGDGVKDLFVVCDNTVVLLYCPIIWPASGPLLIDSMLDGFVGTSFVLPSAIIRFQYDALGRYLVAVTHDANLYLIPAPGADLSGVRRLGLQPIFAFEEPGTSELLISGVHFRNSLVLAKNLLNDTHVKTENTLFSVGTLPGQMCPLGFKLDSLLSECTVCSGQCNLLPKPNVKRLLASSTLFPSLPLLNAFRIARVDGVEAVFLVRFSNGRLFGRIDNNEFTLATDLLLDVKSVLVKDTTVDFGRLSGAAPVVVEVARVGSNVVIAYLDSKSCLVARIYNIPHEHLSLTIELTCLDEIAVDNGRRLAVATLSGSSAKAFAVITLAYDAVGHIGTRKLAWKLQLDSTITELSVPEAFAWPSQRFFLLPPIEEDDDFSAWGGFSHSAMAPNGETLIIWMNRFDDGVFRTAFVSEAGASLASGPSLILGTILTYQAEVQPLNQQDFIAVVSAGSLLRLFTLNRGMNSWSTVSFVTTTPLPFDSVFAFAINHEESRIRVAYTTSQLNEVAVQERLVNGSTFSPPFIVHHASMAISALHYGGFNGLFVQENVYDPLDWMDELGKEILRESLSDFAGYARLGFPARAKLSMFHLNSSTTCSAPSICPTKQSNDDCPPDGSLCKENGRIQALMADPSDLEGDMTPPLDFEERIVLRNLNALESLTVSPQSGHANEVALLDNRGRILSEDSGVSLLPGGVAEIKFRFKVGSVTENQSLNIKLAIRSASGKGSLHIPVHLTLVDLVPRPERIVIAMPSAKEAADIPSTLSITNPNPGVTMKVRVELCDAFVSILSSSPSTTSIEPLQSAAWSVSVNPHNLPTNLNPPQRITSCIRFFYTFGSLSEERLSVCDVHVDVSSECPAGTHRSATVGESGFFACNTCPRGLYQNVPGSASCHACPNEFSWTDDLGAKSKDECVSAPFSFKYNDSLALPCPQGADCTSPSNLQTLRLKTGFWRSSLNSIDLVPCRREGYCVGHVSSSSGSRRVLQTVPEDPRDVVCRANHTGVLCEGCVPPSRMRRGFCVYCDDDAISKDKNRALGIYLGLGLAFLFVICCFFGLPLLGFGTDNAAFQVLRRAGMKFRLIFSLTQVCSLFVINNPELFPSKFRTFLRAFGVFYLDPWTMDLGCAFQALPSNPMFAVLLVSTLAPVVAILLTWIIGGLFAVCAKEEEARARVWDMNWHIVFWILFVCYPGTANAIMRMFTCVQFGGSESSLLSDLSISCDSSVYKSYRGYAISQVILFVIGVPAVCFSVLAFWAGEMRLNPLEQDAPMYYKYSKEGTVVRNRDRSVQFLRPLFAPFEPFFFWFEPFDFIRKLFQTGFAVLLVNVKAQCMFAFGSAMAWSWALIELKPYALGEDDLLAALCQVVLAAISLVALVTSLDPSFVDGNKSEPALFFLFLFPWAVALLQAIWASWKEFSEGSSGEDPTHEPQQQQRRQRQLNARERVKVPLEESKAAERKSLFERLKEAICGAPKMSVGGFGGQFDFENEPQPQPVPPEETKTINIT